MIKKSFTKKISPILAVVLMSSIIYPASVFGQVFGPQLNQENNSGFLYGTVNEDGTIDTSKADGTTKIFDYPRNPTYTFGDQVDALEVPNTKRSENIQDCLTSIVQNSLINTLGGALGGALGSFGLGELIGSATGAIGGTLGGVFNSTLQSILVDNDSALGSSLSDYQETTGQSSGGGGGSTVPVNEDRLRSINEAIRALEVKIEGYTGGEASKNIGDGATSLDAIGNCLAKKTIEGILSGTIDWVNNGFNGNPAFVDDPERFFGDIADYEFGQLLDELSGGLLCSHIDASIRIDLVKDYNTQKYGSSRDRRRCTLSNQVENLEAFVNGDFNQGGWDAWIDYTSNPYSNYYGAQAQIRQDLLDRTSNSQAYAAFELEINNGYHSIRDPETGEITTPGSMIQSQVEKRLNSPIDRLNFADEFDEILNSTINQFVKISIGEVFDSNF